MFRIHGSDDAPVAPVAGPVILLTVLVALGVNIVVLVLESIEYRFLGSSFEEPGHSASSAIGALRRAVGIAD